MGDKMIAFDEFVEDQYEKIHCDEFIKKPSNERADFKRKLIIKIERRIDEVILRKRNERNYEKYTESENEEFQKMKYEKIEGIAERARQKQEKRAIYREKLNRTSDKKEIKRLEKKIKILTSEIESLQQAEWFDIEEKTYDVITETESSFYNAILEKILDKGDGENPGNYYKLKSGDWRDMSRKDREEILGFIKKLREEGWREISDEEMGELEVRIGKPEVRNCYRLVKEYLVCMSLLLDIEEDEEITMEMKAVFEEMRKVGIKFRNVYDKNLEINHKKGEDEIDIQSIIQEMIDTADEKNKD